MGEPAQKVLPPTLWAGIRQPSSTRSLVLLAIGAVVGMIVAGYGLFTAGGTATRSTPPEVVALVNQQPILVSDFISQVQTESGGSYAEATDAEKTKVLNDMIREELMSQRGLEINLPASDPDVRTALVNGVDQQISANVLAKAPSDSELRAYYSAHRPEYATKGTLTVHELFAPVAPGDLTTAALERATNAARDLRAGAAAEQVATKYGMTVLTRLEGEVFEQTARLRLGPRLYPVVSELGSGEVSKPAMDTDGVHVFAVTQRTPAVIAPYEQVQLTVYADYVRAMRLKVEDAAYRYLRNRAQVILKPGFHE